MIDPIHLAALQEEKISQNISKKYYRFRKTQFYGGCATADCLGCNLRCVYCWAQKKVWEPERFGNFYTAQEVAKKLISMNLPLVRISGGEPTLHKKHLFKVLESISKHITFILETNGILLDEEYVEGLSKFENLYVRVSLKGVDEKTFEMITGAMGNFFQRQINALNLLKNYKISHRAAILYDLFTDSQIKSLNIQNLEFETLIKYPFVLKNLNKRGIRIQREK
ncbi:MAG: radical SAM protein [Candidatus Hodarchaeota archaeon]